MEPKIEVTSKKYSLNVKDFVRGLLIAMISTTLGFVYPIIESGNLDNLNVKQAIVVGVSGGVAYLLKNWLQPAQVKQTVSNEQAEVIKATGEFEKAAK